MIYNIYLSKKAEKSLSLLRIGELTKFKEIANELKISPFNYPYKKMKGYQNTYRIRIGGFRILYNVDKGKLIILIIDIDKRGKIYK